MVLVSIERVKMVVSIKGDVSCQFFEDAWAYGVGSCSFVRVEREKEFGNTGSGD